MEKISLADFKRFNQAILHLYQVESAEALSDHICRAIRLLIDVKICGVFWQGFLSMPFQSHYDVPDVVTRHMEESLLRFAHEHPTYGQRHQAAVAISDRLTAKAWRQTAIYQAAYKGFVEDSLGIDIAFGDGCVAGIDVGREEWGFSARDHLWLQLLRPHIEEAYRRVMSWRRSGRSGGWFSVTPDWTLRLQGSATARAILTSHFGAAATAGGKLPMPLQDWLRLISKEKGSLLRSHRWTSEGKVLVVYASPAASPEEDHVLLVAEEKKEQVSPALTRREEEILGWLVKGMTNNEIASKLSISAGTVKRHLENLYIKMGVKNRAAAVIQASRDRGRKLNS